MTALTRGSAGGPANQMAMPEPAIVKPMWSRNAGNGSFMPDNAALFTLACRLQAHPVTFCRAAYAYCGASGMLARPV